MSMKKAVQKRKGFISAITECYLFSQTAATDARARKEFQVRYADLEDTFEKCMLAHNGVIMLVEDTDDDEFKLQDAVLSEARKFFYACKRVYSEIFPADAPLSSGQYVRQNALETPKLKELGIPIFRGDKKLWPSFFDLFNNIIHQHQSLSDVRKLQYLFSYLEDEPLKLLSGISLSDQNYNIAYNKLVNRYQNKRDLASNALSTIMKSSLKNESAKELRNLVDTFSESLEILKSFSFDVDSWDFLLFFILLEKLDIPTRSSFEMSHANSNTEIPTFQSLFQFLEKRCKVLESLPQSAAFKKVPTYQKSNPSPSPNQFVQKPSYKSSNSPFIGMASAGNNSSSSIKCFQCNQNHVLSKCQIFLNLSPVDRLTFVKQKKLCQACFHPSHGVDACNSKYACRTCNSKRHHTLIHISADTDREAGKQDTIIVSHTPPVNNLHVSLNTSGQGPSGTFLLCTAIIDVMDGCGNYQSVRALLDSGSQTGFISEKCIQRLNLPRRSYTTEIFGLNQMSSFTSKGLVHCHIKPRGQVNPLLNFEAIVVPELCSNMPTFTLNDDKWKHLENLKLADPSYFKSRPVDLVIGCELFAQIFVEGRVLGQKGQPSALETIFGWVVMGKVEVGNSTKQTSCFLTSHSPPLEVIIPMFWEIENMPKKQILSKDEKQAEAIFTASVVRQPSGRFMVDLPFRDKINPDLGNTYPQAYRRFLLLENRLIKNPDLYSAYSSFMQDYIDSNHMSLVLPSQPKVDVSCFLAHHCVLKPESVSTKLRVVWDCSAVTPKNISLNNTLLSGPKLQKDIASLLLTFRLNPIAYIADIKQMFRQILIAPYHRPYQRILWRFSPQDPISVWELSTVTFGMTCSPFLAMRTLNELAEREKERFPRASTVIRTSIYIDDILGTSSSLSDALSLQTELIDLLKSGGFELKKWASNCPELLAALPESDRQMPLSFDKEEPYFIKVLGLQWHPKNDIFSYQCQMKDKPPTKRSILSIIGTIFDPLGFLCPLLLQAKFILQQLWISKTDWDEEPDSSIIDSWNKLHSEFPLLSNFQLPRQIKLSTTNTCQIIGFCDASIRGYAGVVYFRVEEENKISVSLICAKSRVAPIKPQTVARLELLGAFLLSELIDFVLSTYEGKITFTSIYTFCDSQVVLHWLSSPPNRWQTFVGNRVNRIQEVIPSNSWRYIPSALNAADIASRGATPSQLISHELWWNAPSFLCSPETEWPDFRKSQTPINFGDINLEEKPTVCCNAIIDTNFLDQLLVRYSSLSKIQRVMCYVLRIVHTLQNHSYQKPTNLPEQKGILENLIFPSLDEMQNALYILIEHVQGSCFSDLCVALSKNKPIPKPFRKLSPFIDERNLIRVGGRLQRSDLLSYSAKHPVLLPNKHRLTTILIESTHRQYLHPGFKTLHNLLLQQFWILSPRRAIHRTISNCLQCFRINPKPYRPPIMASLPSHRINQLKPFSSVAIDFCGPFFVIPHRYRGCRAFKSYVCVFVCTATHCVHLELTMELSTEGFVAAFHRFVSRRGRVTECWSDQGSNFLGFRNQLLLYAREASNNLSIRWHLGPPLSPHFNGLAEAGVKSFKTHLVRVVGDQKLSIMEMSTLVCRIEAVLNSRPLSPASSDPNDLQPLTPGHFLTLEPLNSEIPESDLSEVSLNRLSRWQLIQRLHHDFWKRYSLEYLHTLQQRHKWVDPSPSIKINDLVIILSDHIQSPLKWPVGRVIELHPGRDGETRVATVRTATGIYKRPVVKLCPLPNEN